MVENSPQNFAKVLRARKRMQEAAAKKALEPQPCCQGNVHIAYRGISDGRLYISHDRKFGEIKYFRPNGLRVFCADCRRRMIPVNTPT